MDLMSPRQAAEFCYIEYKLIISEDRIRRWTRGLEGKRVEAIKAGGRIYIEKNSLIDFLLGSKKVK